MIRFIISKEIKDFFKNKATVLFFVFLSFLTAYGFYTAVDLYSKASGAAIDNPLYASGFEPVQGVFVPTFGGLYILLSLLSPFMFINSLSKEKRYNTIYLNLQLPIKFSQVFIAKIISALFVLILSLLAMLPVYLIWYILGGHIPIGESILLVTGYFFYGLFVVSVSFFSAAVFKETSQASIFALALIIFSWFLDFGKEMHILPVMDRLSFLSVTYHLKHFENGLLSLQSALFFILIALLFFYSAYIFYNFTTRINLKKISVIGFVVFLFAMNFQVGKTYDFTESHRNSFSDNKINFLKSIGKLKIKIYLEPTDSRAKDFESDFLNKLKIAKSDVEVRYANEKELKNQYGYFEYRLAGKSEKTMSNSEEEIFSVLEDLSGRKLMKEKKEDYFKGYPLVLVKFGFKINLFYLILLPLIILLTFYITNYRKRSYNEKDI